ncbi:adenylate/guanylate cyclase domain-containing protein [Rhizobium sp. BK456]|uniref:adenylate/guanylate cyclase domain-containing protein n=1 Tax=Rhizobium sp. BK456 TaxID=2587007 RepID=UPI0016214CFE|nr:adenylate/guanylate cyclase domain-containing protein [Rhizobium sp. BK456]MBB3527034.1 class 3 adenylate cyclase [Rhizobium sp. BK456]
MRAFGDQTSNDKRLTIQKPWSKFKAWLEYNAVAAGERTLERTQRAGFVLAVLGRTVAVALLAFAFLWGYHYPTNVVIFAFTFCLAVAGLLALTTVNTRFESAARYLFFAMDAILVSLILVYAPLSSGDNIPQNLAFLTSRVQYYYVVIAASVLTLSPGLVISTGTACITGLALSTIRIVASMPHVLTFDDLPSGPSRRVFYQVVLSPDFIGIASRVEEGLIMAAVTGIAAVAVHRARSVVRARLESEKRRRQIQHLFGKYVPAPIIRELEHDGQLTPQMKDATLLFADVEGFTAIAENLAPARVIALLNELFSSVEAIVGERGGLVVNYFGDALIASFNMPVPLLDHAFQAVLAAQDILDAVSRTEFDGRRLKLRIGIATGTVAAGTVGGEARLSYTLYGDTVNLSQRLEALNKNHNTQCLLSGDTFERIADRVPGLKSLGVLEVRNRKQPVAVYALPNPE